MTAMSSNSWQRSQNIYAAKISISWQPEIFPLMNTDNIHQQP
jgi:hypothetical protein